jgi:aryl sulfotransferase
MTTAPVRRAVEREYRTVIYDNRRWEHFAPRPGDVFVCTPPKCGTTWTQTIVVTLLHHPNDPPAPVMNLAPWFDSRFVPVDEVAAGLDAQTHRRSLKTHTPADGIPWYPDASYVVVARDGRDAFMSMLNHVRSMRPEVVQHLTRTAKAEGIELAGAPPPIEDVHAFYASWLESGVWFDHLASFWSHRDETNVLFVHYDDLKADLEAQMRRIAEFLDIEVAATEWPKLVDRCTFESMKARADEIGGFESFVGGAESFLYKGTNGRWRDVLTPDELSAFAKVSAERLPPDAAAWINDHAARAG